MSGVCALLNTKGPAAQAEEAESMLRAIAHRGPDGSAVHAEGPVALGYCLSSMPRAKGSPDDAFVPDAQPLYDEKTQRTLICDGELYNARELRGELLQQGCRFRSASHAEVMLRAYEVWGASCVVRFNGSFALLLWDAKERFLFAARDRYGTKPLYYASFRGITLFASEVKGILAHPAARCSLDAEALLEYFTFQNFFTDKTLYAGVQTFPAGSYAFFPANGASPGFTRYWDYLFQEPEQRRTDEDYLEELDFLFQQAVSRRLGGCSELGVLLSGGVDSGAIAAVASRRHSSLKSFCCGFDLHSVSGLELSTDEREQAEHLSYLFGTEHYEVVLKGGDLKRVMPALARHIEEPRVGQSYPNFYIARLAGKFVKVALAGAGGDEFFGGYPWRYYRAVGCNGFEDYIDNYYRYWQRLVPNSVMPHLFAPVWEKMRHVWTRDIFRSVFISPATPCTPEDYLNLSLYFEARTFLHGLLIVDDKLSMAHGLQLRTPFLDNDLVEFAMRLPARLKVANLGEVVRISENEPGNKFKKYFAKTNDGKVLLRRMLERYVPSHIANGVKQGFSAPDASWFRGDSMEFVRHTLLTPATRLYEFMDRETVRSLLDEHLSGKENRRLLIWSLLSFEWWLRCFL